MRTSINVLWDANLHNNKHNYDHSSFGSNITTIPDTYHHSCDSGCSCYASRDSGDTYVYVNVLQVTVQQLQKGSSGEVSAYIHWLVWTEALGLAIYSVLVNVASSCDEGTSGIVLIIIACLQIVVFLVSGISWCCFSKTVQSYFPSIRTQSPYTVVYQVVKYAFTRRRPRTWESPAQQEDSMTSFISGNEVSVQASSRLDYSKDIFGGPFTNQQVEDVKSCGRIFMVVLSLSAIFITNIPTSMVASVFASHIQQDNSGSCSARSIIVSSFSSLLPVILIPLYELVIYPLIGRYIPASPKKIGLGMVLLTVSLIFYFIADTVGHSKNPVVCMFDDISVRIDIRIFCCYQISSTSWHIWSFRLEGWNSSALTAQIL